MGTKVIPMSENHRRGIATTLVLLDEALCRFEEWAQGREAHSVLYQERNGLSQEQRVRLQAEVQTIRRTLRSLGDELGLTPTTRNAADDIWSTCSSLRDHVTALESKYLRRYGDVPGELARRMDTEVLGLVESLDRLVSLATEKKPVPPA